MSTSLAPVLPLKYALFFFFISSTGEIKELIDATGEVTRERRIGVGIIDFLDILLLFNVSSL